MLTDSQTFLLNEHVQMPAVGFGTFLIPEDATAEAVYKAIAMGYRHIDTAAVYDNETGVGRGVRKAIEILGLKRQDLFITTKLWPGNSAWGEHPKNEAETLEAFEHSLKLLGLEYVDLYLIHSPHADNLRTDQWRALLKLKQTGKIRAAGVSNFTEAHIRELLNAGLNAPDANQVELHPWSQKPELIAFMHSHHIAPIAYSSLAPLSTWRAEPGQPSAKTDDLKSNGDAFKGMAIKYGVSEAQLLLRWGVQSGYAVLPKTLHEDRMRQNLDVFRFSLDDTDMAKIRTMDKGAGFAWPTGVLEI